VSGLDIGIAIADLVAIALFILGLHDLNSPPTARRGNRLAMVGMFIALVAVLVQTLGVGWEAIAIGTVIGVTIYMPLYCQTVLGASASVSGLALIAYMGGATIGSLVSTRFVVRIKHYEEKTRSGGA